MNDGFLADPVRVGKNPPGESKGNQGPAASMPRSVRDLHARPHLAAMAARRSLAVGGAEKSGVIMLAAGWRSAHHLQCRYYDGMSVVISIRDVPDDVRDELAGRAARAGKSLQEYLRAMFVEAAARPPVDDVIARARARVAATGSRVDGA